MTPTRATTPRPLASDVRSARVSGRVCEAGCHTAGPRIGAPTIRADDANCRGGMAPRRSAGVPSAESDGPRSRRQPCKLQ